MTSRELYLQRQAAERPIFLRVLRALPKEAIGYRPHDRSPSAEQLVWTLTNELQNCLEAVVEKRSEWRVSPPPPFDEMLAVFEQRSNELAERVAQMSDAAWDSPAHFYFSGKKVSEQPVGAFLWYILFDSIHHRGQLSAYLRPMGGKVPAIYGPSADERSAG